MRTGILHRMRVRKRLCVSVLEGTQSIYSSRFRKYFGIFGVFVKQIEVFILFYFYFVFYSYHSCRGTMHQPHNPASKPSTSSTCRAWPRAKHWIQLRSHRRAPRVEGDPVQSSASELGKKTVDALHGSNAQVTRPCSVDNKAPRANFMNTATNKWAI